MLGYRHIGLALAAHFQGLLQPVSPIIITQLAQMLMLNAVADKLKLQEVVPLVDLAQYHVVSPEALLCLTLLHLLQVASVKLLPLTVGFKQGSFI
jgi:hypothetical protein